MAEATRCPHCGKMSDAPVEKPKPKPKDWQCAYCGRWWWPEADYCLHCPCPRYTSTKKWIKENCPDGFEYPEDWGVYYDGDNQKRDPNPWPPR